MSNIEPISSTMETKANEGGSPKKGLRLLLAWLLWIIQVSFALVLAYFVWGELGGPSAFGITLSVLSIAALYATFKNVAVLPFFKRVNYLILYAAFLLGLWLYRWLLQIILPDAWIPYWWLPFLFLAPLVLKLPIIDLELASFVSLKLYNTLLSIALIGVAPLLIVYTILYGLLHPKQATSYIKQKITSKLSILVGLLFYFAFIVLITPESMRPKFLDCNYSPGYFRYWSLCIANCNYSAEKPLNQFLIWLVHEGYCAILGCRHFPKYIGQNLTPKCR